MSGATYAGTHGRAHRSGSARMPAVVKSADGAAGIRLREVPVPVPGPGQVRVRVVAAGVCGTDLHLADDEYAHVRPVVMGHEVTGVVDLAPGHEDWTGRRVALETYASTCGSCPQCRDGRPNLCHERRSIGSFVDGGFAQHVVIPLQNLHLLPDHVAELEGVLAEPLACVVHCLMDPPRVQAGDRVLITGPGTMGQLTARVSTTLGASVTLVGLGEDADRLAVARKHGAGTAVPGEVVPGEFDVAVEASGTGPALATAIAGLRRGGHLVLMGIMGRPVEVDLDQVFSKELTISTGFASTPASWRRACTLIETGAVTLTDLITTTRPLALWKEAFDDVRRRRGLKTVLVPAGTTTSPDHHL
jgi:L-iditol 2-dehydrogenase